MPADDKLERSAYPLIQGLLGFPALAAPGWHIGESVRPRVAEARRGAGGVCSETCGKCARRRGFLQDSGRTISQALGVYEVTLVCAVALEGHDSLDVTKTWPEKSKQNLA